MLFGMQALDGVRVVEAEYALLDVVVLFARATLEDELAHEPTRVFTVIGLVFLCLREIGGELFLKTFEIVAREFQQLLLVPLPSLLGRTFAEVRGHLARNAL